VALAAAASNGSGALSRWRSISLAAASRAETATRAPRARRQHRRAADGVVARAAPRAHYLALLRALRAASASAA